MSDLFAACKLQEISIHISEATSDAISRFNRAVKSNIFLYSIHRIYRPVRIRAKELILFIHSVFPIGNYLLSMVSKITIFWVRSVGSFAMFLSSLNGSIESFFHFSYASYSKEIFFSLVTNVAITAQ